MLAQFEYGQFHYPQVLTKIDNNIFEFSMIIIVTLSSFMEQLMTRLYGFYQPEYSEKAFGYWIYDEYWWVLLLSYIFIGFSMNDLRFL